MNNRARAALGVLTAATFLVSGCGSTDAKDKHAEDSPPAITDVTTPAATDPDSHFMSEDEMPPPAPGDVTSPGQEVPVSESGMCTGSVWYDNVHYAFPTKDREDEVDPDARPGKVLGQGETRPCMAGDGASGSDAGSPVEVRAVEGVAPSKAVWLDRYGVLLADNG